MAQREITRRLGQIFNVLQQVAALDQLANADEIYGNWALPRVIVDPATFRAFKENIDKSKILEDWGDKLWIDAGQGRIVMLGINANAQEETWKSHGDRPGVI